MVRHCRARKMKEPLTSWREAWKDKRKEWLLEPSKSWLQAKVDNRLCVINSGTQLWPSQGHVHMWARGIILHPLTSQLPLIEHNWKPKCERAELRTPAEASLQGAQSSGEKGGERIPEDNWRLSNTRGAVTLSWGCRAYWTTLRRLAFTLSEMAAIEEFWAEEWLMIWKNQRGYHRLLQ